MLIVTESAIKLWIDGDPADLRTLYDHFKFRPPDYWRSAAFALWKRTKGKSGWDGYLSRVQRANGRYFMLRGHRDDLTSHLQDDGVDHKLKLLESPFKSLVPDDLPDDLIKASFALDEHQRECVAGLLKDAIGTVRMVVSSGKTAAFFAAYSMIKRTFPQARALYVTPTERLVRQVFAEGKKFLPDLDISQFGGGVRDWSGKDVVVATAASIHANHEELVEEGWFKTFMVLLYDEVHHVQSPSGQRIAESIPAFFRLGASDTVKDERKEDIVKRWKIQGLLGPCRAEIAAAPLINVGRVAKPFIHLIDVPEWEGQYDHVPHRAEPGTPAWALVNDEWIKGTYVGPGVERDPETGKTVLDKFGFPIQVPGYQVIAVDGEELDVESRQCLLHRAYDAAVINNKPRNKLVVDWAEHFARQGWPTLVVATRTLHVHLLRTMVEDRGLEVEMLTSEHSSKERDRVFAWLVAEPGRVLISPLVKEGVSIPELRGGVVADFVSSPDLARQIIGRFIRKKPRGDNHASLVWFIDRTCPSMRHGSLKLFDELQRLRGYRFSHPCGGPDQIGQWYEEASAD
jgi:superfamily II DNA or RNA helicase